jgi:CubicO group peptidase (beta-lactamase class C family)
VDSLFAAWNSATSPGCGVGVVQDGRFVYRANYGSANLERGTPIGPRTTFYMASVSKQFAAASVALASLQGKLSLDDDVRKYVPELPDYGRPITVRHLIHHTSGIRDYLGLQTLAGRLAGVNSDADVIALIARQRALNFPTGNEYSYTNSGYMLLSAIIRKATGMSLREYADRELFRPLGMSDTYFYDDHSQPHPAGDRRAIGYNPRRGGGGGGGGGAAGYESAVLPNFEQVGDGGLMSTVEDVLRWDQSFYDGKVGGPRFLELIQTGGRLANGTQQEYAFGLMVRDYGGLRAVVHSGGFMGYRTIIQRFPAQRFSVIILCNVGTATPEELAPAIADIYLADELDRAQGPLAGEYWSDELQASWRIAVGGGRVRLEGPAESASLRSQGKDAYQVESQLGRAVVQFTRDGERVTGLTVNLGPRTTGVRFVKR